MELSQLCTILGAAQSSNPQQRNAAEQTLLQFQHSPGQLVNLLRVAVEESVDLGTRQAAAISFKNLVRKDWEGAGSSGSAIPEADKAAVRDNLLEGIVRAPPLVRAQLGECLKSIVYSDFPERWPLILEAVQQQLATQEQARMRGALYALRILARKYEFKDEEERGPLAPIVAGFLPPLLQILQNLLALNSASLEVAELLKLVLKTFWSATFMGVPAVLLRPDQFTGWTGCFLELIRRPVPQEGQPQDWELRKAWPWWKVKKWTLHVAHRLFKRYGDPRGLAEGWPERAFADLWRRHCSAQFLQAQLELLALVPAGHYVSPRVMNLALQSVTDAVALSSTWKLLRPAMAELLTMVVFPALCFDDEDALLWRDDPQEYIRKGYDIMEEMYNSKTAAMNLVHELCKLRPRGNLDTFMKLCVGVMNEFQAAGANAPVEQVRRMDGALLAMGALSDVLKSKEPYKQQLEPMLVRYVLPTFGSQAGHLRAKAAWVAGQFADIRFRERPGEGALLPRGAGATFQGLFQSVLGLLRDVDLPIRVDAVAALRNLVEAFDDDHLDTIKPLLPELLNLLFALMVEVESEDLVFTLETIVEKFGEEMAPYAVGVCQHLTQAFWRACEQENGAGDDDSDDGEGALAAYGCLRALYTVLESVSGLPQLLPQLEGILFPIMQRMVSTEGQDVFEDVLEIVAYFTFFSPEISESIWSLWPQIHQCFHEWAIDYFEHILVPIDNYITRGTEKFLSNPTFLQQATAMAEKALRNEDLAEAEAECAPKVLELVLQACRGRVDHCVGHYIALALDRLPSAERSLLKDLLVNVVANALYYNPALALRELQQQSRLTTFFSTWFQMIFATQRRTGKHRHFRRMHDKKVNVLALAAVLGAPDAALPREVAAGLPQLMAGLLRLLVALKQQQEELEADEDDDDGSGDAAEGSDSDEEVADEEEEEEAHSRRRGEAGGSTSGGLGDDEDEDVDTDYVKRLARKHARRKGLRHEESGSEDEWTEDEEEGTALQDIEPFSVVADTLRGVQAHNPARFQVLTSGMDASAQTALQAMMLHAEAPRQET
ncbi:hypothetical protein WJX81_008385 [Elliptochloris bilobata]|uniref:Importin N-terminal domain-containing protein n=1 Tax=Elliptochloris bilobata TaxID=381761 RepID=A0AAW1S293_9CHLO